jgi:hypothetical protein
MKNKNYLFTCKGCGIQWSTYPHIAIKNSFCTNCSSTQGKESKMQNVYDYFEETVPLGLTEKQRFVIGELERNPNFSTRDIIQEYDEYTESRDSISARHVQRIRKMYTEALEALGKGKDNNMNQDQDVFNAKDGFSNNELDIINMANEGGWSVQQLAKRIDEPIEVVKKTLEDYHYMITENVLDEGYEGVYFLYKDAPLVNNKLRPELPVGASYVDEGSEIYSVDEVTDDGTEQANSDGNDEFWEVEIDCVKACSKAEKEVDVYLNRKTIDKAIKFMKWAKKREWLAYLVGKKEKDGYHIEDLYLPDQRASAVLVDKIVAEKYNQLAIVGVIHSHHEMGAGDEDRPSFSGHDANFINGNHNISLLAGRDSGGGFKIVGITRVMTPCGSRMQVKANVKPENEPLPAFEKLLRDEFMSKVFGKNTNEKENGVYHFVNKTEMKL